MPQKQISLQNNHHHHHGDPELRHQMVMRGCWVSCFGFEQRAWGGDIIVHTAVQHPFPFNGFKQGRLGTYRITVPQCEQPTCNQMFYTKSSNIMHIKPATENAKRITVVF